MKRSLALTSAFGLATLSLLAFAPYGMAQREVALMDPAEAQAQLERATRASQSAQARAERFERQAAQATEALERTAREAASLAAEVQQAEAAIAAEQARYSLARTDRIALSERLAEREEPLVRLTGALQTAARRPLVLSALQPGSLKDLVYVRAVLDSAIPAIRNRTAALRGELAEGRRLERQAADALDALRSGEEQLRERRAQLATIETRQRMASRNARANASRESERALTLAEEARDLDGLMGRMTEAAQLRRELAALPGPLLRPSDRGSDRVNVPRAISQTPRTATAPPVDFQLPVQGRIVTGFGERLESGASTNGLELAPSSGAQVVAPASGRIAFAGRYRGYGRIVIVEHDGGWTSLVTGLAQTGVAVGDEVIGGTPLGTAENRNPAITLELRREGEPVNPLQFLG